MNRPLADEYIQLRMGDLQTVLSDSLDDPN